MNALAGTTWTKETARIGFPILVEFAKYRKPITYGIWDDVIVNRRLGHHVHSAQYGYPAGTIGDACCDYERKYGVKVPPINLLVVNKRNGVPGKGVEPYADSYIRNYLRRRRLWGTLSLDEKQAVIQQAHEQIYEFPDWHLVLKEFGLRANKIVRNHEPRKKASSYRNTWARGGEGEAHKRLKEYIRKNPNVIGLPKNSVGIVEFLLPSGDEIDVYFRAARLAVEVKAREAPIGELHRGLFQCVKYRALVQAMRKSDGEIPQGKSLLVIEGELPADLRKVAAIIGVQVREKVKTPSSFNRF